MTKAEGCSERQRVFLPPTISYHQTKKFLITSNSRILLGLVREGKKNRETVQRKDLNSKKTRYYSDKPVAHPKYRVSLQEFKACGTVRVTIALTSNPTKLLTKFSYPLGEGKNLPFSGIKTVYLNLCCPTQDVQLSMKNHKAALAAVA